MGARALRLGYRNRELLYLAVVGMLTGLGFASVYIARQLMRQMAPSLLWITMHDIDIAHAGAYSLYIDGIRRTDRHLLPP